jgi:hypothetical protein
MGKKNKQKNINKKQLHRNVVGGLPPRPAVLKQNIKIMVGMPIHHYIEPYTWMCLGDSTAELAKQGIGFLHDVPVGIPDVAKARNKCVDSFLEDKSFTHLMWIDADMIWTAEDVLTLLKHDVPVASALVTKKGPPFDITLFQILKNEDGDPDTYNVPFGNYPIDKPFTFPNSGIGTAFMLIKREVIEKMQRPMFAGFVSKKGELKGTDYYFCTMMMVAGYEILYDPRPRIYHIGKGIYSVEDHIAFLDKQDEEGIEKCPFMSSSVEDVIRYKRSFAGPQPSLKDKTAIVVGKQLESFLSSVASKSGISLCRSSSGETPKNQEKKTGTDAPKSQKPKDNSPTSKPPNKSDTPNTSDVEQERRVGNDP